MTVCLLCGDDAVTTAHVPACQYVYCTECLQSYMLFERISNTVQCNGCKKVVPQAEYEAWWSAVPQQSRSISAVQGYHARVLSAYHEITSAPQTPATTVVAKKVVNPRLGWQGCVPCINDCGTIFSLGDGCDIVTCPNEGCKKQQNICGSKDGHSSQMSNFIKDLNQFHGRASLSSFFNLSKTYPDAWRALNFESLRQSLEAAQKTGNQSTLDRILDDVGPWPGFKEFLMAKFAPRNPPVSSVMQLPLQSPPSSSSSSFPPSLQSPSTPSSPSSSSMSSSVRPAVIGIGATSIKPVQGGTTGGVSQQGAPSPSKKWPTVVPTVLKK